MAKEELLNHRKFAHLMRILGEPRHEVLGRLEVIYLTAHAAANPTFKSGDEIEGVAGWQGKRGRLIAALVRAGFVDPPKRGKYTLHDYWDHAPRYVHQRRDYRASKTDAKPREFSRNRANSHPTDPDPDTETRSGGDRKTDHGGGSNSASESGAGGSTGSGSVIHISQWKGGSDPKTAGNGPASAAEVLSSLSLGLATGGDGKRRPRRMRDFWAMDQAALVEFIAGMDRKNDPKAARRNWRKRVAELASKGDGLEFLRRALKHCAHTHRRDRADCGPPVENVAAFLNSVTLKFLRGEHTEIAI